MSIKIIFVPLLGLDGEEDLLEAAGYLAGRCGARVQAIHVKRDLLSAVSSNMPIDTLGSFGAGAPMASEVATVTEATQLEIGIRQEKAESIFHRWRESQTKKLGTSSHEYLSESATFKVVEGELT